MTRTNNEQVRVDREEGTPSKTGKVVPAVVHLSRSVVEQLAQGNKDDETDQLQQQARDNTETLEDEVGKVKVAGAGNTGGK